METIIEEKIELDNRIIDLIKEFSEKNKCGYKGEISVHSVSELINNEQHVIVATKATINTVITT